MDDNLNCKALADLEELYYEGKQHHVERINILQNNRELYDET